MKGNDGKGNTPSRDDWTTPERLFEILLKQYHFEFDCCASLNNAKCQYFSDDFLNKSDLSWFCVWMNPPFSKAQEMFEHFFKVTTYGVAIYRCDNLESKVWQKTILPNADWVFIPDHRVKYGGHQGISPRFPSALIGKGVEPPTNITGVCLFPGGK